MLRKDPTGIDYIIQGDLRLGRDAPDAARSWPTLRVKRSPVLE